MWMPYWTRKFQHTQVRFLANHVAQIDELSQKLDLRILKFSTRLENLKPGWACQDKDAVKDANMFPVDNVIFI